MLERPGAILLIVCMPLHANNLATAAKPLINAEFARVGGEISERVALRHYKRAIGWRREVAEGGECGRSWHIC